MTFKIGIDFDNTLVVYDRLFHRIAVERFGMPAETPAVKPAVRDYFWHGPGGLDNWIELQGIVYGTQMAQAALAPGAAEFLMQCRRHAVPVAIISHKTAFPARGPKVSLHRAARRWMASNGFFDPGRFAIPEPHVFFETTREEKLARIHREKCAVFIDDLPEVFREPLFPEGVRRILYDPGARHDAPEKTLVCSSWEAVTHAVYGFTPQGGCAGPGC